MRIIFTFSLLVGFGVLLAGYCKAGDSLPGQGYSASRYETLWMKSPFSVATPDTTDQSAEYVLVGIANLDGIDYASLVNKQTNDRYLLASGKPQNGLSLVSITHGEDRDKTFAVIQNKGETITLKLSDTPPPAVAGGNMSQVANAGVTMPGQPLGTINPAMYLQTGGGFPSTMAPMSPQAFGPGSARGPGQPPMPMIRHPIIHVPTSPPQQQ